MVCTLAAFTCPGESSPSAIELLPHPEHVYVETDDRQATVTVMRAVYAVGDSSDIAALAIIGNDYRNPAYSAATRPGEFVFASSAPTVASIVAPGSIKALSPGESLISAKHLGLIDTLRVVVLPRLSALRATASAASVRVGESATVSLEVTDPDSRPVPRVYAYLYSDQPTVVAVREGSLTLQALATGTAPISARVIGQDVRAATWLTVAP